MDATSSDVRNLENKVLRRHGNAEGIKEEKLSKDVLHLPLKGLRKHIKSQLRKIDFRTESGKTDYCETEEGKPMKQYRQKKEKRKLSFSFKF
jgi:hypothetical protein